ncbi:MAG TPA: M48 family metalloprotease [Ignavibacteria bacterium]|nr:M48 family metalloprotease [Ignavibacteria bacterium]
MEKISNKKILNPFALPSETDARFRLLLVAVIVISLILGNYMPLYFLPDDLSKDLLSPDVNFTEKNPDSPDYLKESGINMISNALEYFPSVIIMSFILFLTTICIAIIYRRYPGNIISEQKLISADKDETGKYRTLKEEIKNLSDRCGIESLRIYIAPEFTAGAQAFGSGDQKSIRIDNGLRLMLIKSRDKFRSVILHELGHFANRDVKKTYLSQSVWKAVLYVFAIPTFILALFTLLKNVIGKLSGGPQSDEIKNILFQSIPVFIILVLSLTAVFLTVHLLLKSILRTREFYADWRAAIEGAKESLISYFGENLNREKISSGIKVFFRWHPSLKERIDCLKDPSVLFIMKYDLCFFVGLLIPFSILSILTLGKVAISLTGIISGAGQVISQNPGISFFTITISILLFIFLCFIPFIATSYLISSSLGIQIQRSVIFSLSSGDQKKKGIKKLFLISLILTSGMAAGCLILPYFSVLNIFVTSGFKEILLDKIPYMILTTILAFSVNFLWVYYVKHFTENLFSRYNKSVTPGKRNFIFNIVSSLLLSVMILPVAVLYFNIYSTDIELLNELLIYLLLAVPVIYLIIFILTGLILGIVNSKKIACNNCGKQLPQGNLIGKNCESCNSVISGWLYL